MRVAVVALVAVIGFMASPVSVRAAPAVPHDGLMTGPAGPMLEIRDGCGLGWHRVGWRDRWGYWRSRCVPNRGPRWSPYWGPRPH
jgi:hypothetical protein